MFSPISDILNRIEQRVEESHGDVINALFDHIDRKIAIMEVAAKKCSYGAVLGDYVGCKIMAHHMRKHIDDLGPGETSLMLGERLYDYERRARAVRMGMYSNVCHDCPACKSRRKPWPASVECLAEIGWPRKMKADPELLKLSYLSGSRVSDLEAARDALSAG